MGARRFAPDLGAFLQQDQFSGALADLGLATDPLTQNRYALAGGNPISYVEWDGHAVTPDNPVSANPTLNVKLNATPAPRDPPPPPSPTTQRLININSQPPGTPAGAGAGASAGVLGPTKIDPSKLGQLQPLCGTGELGAAVGAGQTVTKSQSQLQPLHATCPLQTQRPALIPVPLGNGLVAGVQTNVPGLLNVSAGSDAGSGGTRRFVVRLMVPFSGSKVGAPGYSKGKPGTKSQLDRIRDAFLAANPDYVHTAGGREAGTGHELPEERIPTGFGRSPTRVQPDLTFEHVSRNPDLTVRINTYMPTGRGGRMTQAERQALDLIWELRGGIVIGIPKE
jgi:hypothetical protein